MFIFIRSDAMSTVTKIHLSPQEMELVNNTGWILAKQQIIKKVFELFGDINAEMKKAVQPYQHLFPVSMRSGNGKITKGENYRSLPYVMLDFPAFFEKENILAIRTMFWWGNFFSITLQVSGIHQQKFTRAEKDMLAFLQKNEFFICVNGDQWQHHFEPENYISALQLSLHQFQEIIDKNFFKVSKKTALSEWEHAGEFLTNAFGEILQFLEISCQGGKTSP